MPGTPLIAANWKMHMPPKGWDVPDSPYRPKKGLDVVVFPTFLDIAACVHQGFLTGAQHGHLEEPGAFTGDVCMHLIAAHGARYVLCGHSERRGHHDETDEEVAAQVDSALRVGLLPIVCVGETAAERAAGETRNIVERQVCAVPLPHAFAYEPVWAIGTGKAASPTDAQDMHAFIRSLLPVTSQGSIRILYGGSVNPDNASDFMAQSEVDGLLVGAASLMPDAFGTIVETAAGT